LVESHAQILQKHTKDKKFGKINTYLKVIRMETEPNRMEACKQTEKLKEYQAGFPHNSLLIFILKKRF
jgi:hypothetical protein